MTPFMLTSNIVEIRLCQTSAASGTHIMQFYDTNDTCQCVDAPEPRQTFQRAPSHEYYSEADEEYDVVFCAPVSREWLPQAKRITARMP